MDEILKDVVSFVVLEKQVNPVLLQLKFCIGYERAMKLIRKMEELKIIEYDKTEKCKVNVNVENALKVLTKTETI